MRANVRPRLSLTRLTQLGHVQLLAYCSAPGAATPFH